MSTGTSPGVIAFPYWRSGIIISRGDKVDKEMVLVDFEKGIKLGKEVEPGGEKVKVGIITIKAMFPYNRGLEKQYFGSLLGRKA